MVSLLQTDGFVVVRFIARYNINKRENHEWFPYYKRTGS